MRIKPWRDSIQETVMNLLICRYIRSNHKTLPSEGCANVTGLNFQVVMKSNVAITRPSGRFFINSSSI